MSFPPTASPPEQPTTLRAASMPLTTAPRLLPADTLPPKTPAPHKQATQVAPAAKPAIPAAQQPAKLATPTGPATPATPNTPTVPPAPVPATPQIAKPAATPAAQPATQPAAQQQQAAPAPEITLPMEKIPKESDSPRILLLMSKPKVGKTVALANLPGCLILDTQKGTRMMAAMKIDCTSIAELNAIGAAIKKAGFPYKFIAFDVLTDLEKMCIDFAEKLYARTAQGKNWFTPKTGGKAQYGTILDMPNGAGYQWIREALDRVLSFLYTLAPYIIISAHIKDTKLDKADDTIQVIELDLMGKSKRTLMSYVDSIGYVYRKGNQNLISFRTGDDIAGGTRAEHLSNKTVVLSEKDPVTGVLTTYWECIYPDVFHPKPGMKKFEVKLPAATPTVKKLTGTTATTPAAIATTKAADAVQAELETLTPSAPIEENEGVPEGLEAA